MTDDPTLPDASGADGALPLKGTKPSDIPSLAGFGGTHHGVTREANQDTFLCEASGEFGLYAAIDGVGGYAGGHIAAAIARDRIRAHVGRLSSAPEDLLREAVVNANNAIVDRSRNEPVLAEMACVLTVALVDPQQQRVYVAHVGDTRLYLRRGDTLTKVTPDHSFVGLREDAGQISEAEAMAHPRRNEILRDVGTEIHAPDDPDFVFTTSAEFRDGDALLLCSDGLTDLVPLAELTRFMSEFRGTPRHIVNGLVSSALASGGTDNVTVVVVEHTVTTGVTAAPRPRSSDTQEFPPDAFADVRASASGARGLGLPATPPTALPGQRPGPETPAAKRSVPTWAKGVIGLLLLLLLAGAGYILYERFRAPDTSDTPTPTTPGPLAPEAEASPPPPEVERNDVQARIDQSRETGLPVRFSPGERSLVPTLVLHDGTVIEGEGAVLSLENNTEYAFIVPPGVSSVTVRNLTVESRTPESLLALLELQSPEAEVILDNVSVIADDTLGTPLPIAPIRLWRNAGASRPFRITITPSQPSGGPDTPGSATPPSRAPLNLDGQDAESEPFGT